MRWTAPGAEYDALSSQPTACLSIDSKDSELIQAGQALFNTPALLGGQAAKAGLSCASCHVNGRDNPNFLMHGVSVRPGTADVTSSFFSAVRGNGRFDPVPIPDLAAPGKIARDPAAKQLAPFIRILIVDEFAGQEPSSAMLDALSAYVRAIRPCAPSRQSRSLDDQLTILQGAVEGAVYMARRGDPQAARTLVAAARHQLGLISERYAGPELNSERSMLLTASRTLQTIGDSADDLRTFEEGLSEWIGRYDGLLQDTLEPKLDKSLYNPSLLPMKPRD